MYLNCHTYYSFKFGTMSPEELLREANAKSVRKLVLADVNSTTAILDFHRLAPQYSVQPVAGIDFRNGVQQQFIGIAKNQEGFHELNELLTKCFSNGAEGLTGREAVVPARAPVVANALVIYPFALLQEMQQPDNLQQEVDGFSRKKGKIAITDLRENEFIGVKPADLSRLRFSYLKDFTEKLVILAPVTFRDKKDFNVHRLLRAIDNNTILSKLPVSEQSDANEVMISDEALCKCYEDFPFILLNTGKLMEQCEPINFEFGTSKNKKTFTGSLKGDCELLLKLCHDNLAYRYPKKGKKVIDRFEHEIQLITELGFAAYFLINWDIVRYAHLRGFFHVGRGSGANSMVAYLLGITDVDPIELDLYFERFINAFRTSPPDFDIDFSWKDRDEIIEYIFKRNLMTHTCLLGAYSTFQANAVVRELGKVFGLPKAEIDALQDPGLFPATNDHITKLIYQYARWMHDFPNHLTIHACGILISDKPMTWYTALSKPPKGFPLAQFSMLEAEDVGFAKFDILSQRGLGHIKDAVEIIKNNCGVLIDIHDVNRFKKDKKVEEHLTAARLMGCFYVESPAMRMLLTKLKAKTYLDLVAASSIIRPGVAQSGMMQEYIRRFHDPDHGKKEAIPQLWELMPETYGVMVYQEDVIKVAHFFADLSLGEADMLRRGMSGKYKGRSEFQKVKDGFFSNCKKKGYEDALTKEVWREIESFGGYAFAKGHSASFAVESYQSMFLKAYYPVEFMVAVINNHGGFFRTEYYVHEARMMGGIIQAPCINHSEVLTSIQGKTIYLGFELMKELEVKSMTAILQERTENGVFADLTEFMRRVSVSVDQLRILIRVGAFRFTGRTKQQLLWDIHSVIGNKKKSIARKELFDTEYKKFDLPELYQDQFVDARDEIEILEFPLCSPFSLIRQPLPADAVAADLKNYREKVISIVGYYVTYKPTRTKKGEAMMFGCFLDKDGFFFDTNHFPAAAKKFPFRGKGCYHIKGKVAEEFGFYSINVLEMHKLDYLMYEDDAETVARSRPDPVITPVVVAASKEYQYVLVIDPPPHIRHEVELLKKNFHRHFDHYQAVASKPHLELCSFLVSGTKEAALIKQIASVAGRHASFGLTLKNFGSFLSHTIYIDVLNPDDFVDVVTDLKKELQLPPKESGFYLKPHLTIARGLDKEKFSRASAVFCEREYAASFVAGSMVLLKKEAGVKFGKYETVREFGFGGTRKRVASEYVEKIARG